MDSSSSAVATADAVGSRLNRPSIFISNIDISVTIEDIAAAVTQTFNVVPVQSSLRASRDKKTQKCVLTMSSDSDVSRMVAEDAPVLRVKSTTLKLEKFNG